MQAAGSWYDAHLRGVTCLSDDQWRPLAFQRKQPDAASTDLFALLPGVDHLQPPNQYRGGIDK